MNTKTKTGYANERRRGADRENPEMSRDDRLELVLTALADVSRETVRTFRQVLPSHHQTLYPAVWREIERLHRETELVRESLKSGGLCAEDHV